MMWENTPTIAIFLLGVIIAGVVVAKVMKFTHRIENNQASLGSRLATTEISFTVRFEKLEVAVADLQVRMTNVETRLQNVEIRLAVVETKLDMVLDKINLLTEIVIGKNKSSP